MTLKAIEHPIAKQADVLVNICSAAGTGDVLKVQKLLHHCEDHYEKKESDKEGEEDKKDEKEVDDTFQGFAVIGIALIAMGEDVGAEMSLRQFNHLVGGTGLRGFGESLTGIDECRCITVNLRFGRLSPWRSA
jgi:26S proteasome regulatory subunit N1